MRIGVSIANFNDGTSFYRGHGVTSELHKIDHTLNVEYIKDTDIVKLKGMGCSFVQRPDQQRDIILMKTLKKLNIPIIIDYDDYLLGVPEFNRYHKIMDIAGNDYKVHVKQALSIADMVWTSTDELCLLLKKYNSNIHVIRNAFDDQIYTPYEGFNTTKTVLWRGSSTHEKDLELHLPQITALIKNNQDFKFVFLIDKFFSWLLDLQKNYKNVELIKAVPVFEYFYKLEQIKASIMIVPLEHSEFNKCKSDVAAIEGIGTGALVVAPDWDEWRELSTHLYKTNEDFLYQTQTAIDSVKAGLNTSMKKPKVRLLSEANKKRVELIKECVSGYRRK